MNILVDMISMQELIDSPKLRNILCHLLCRIFGLTQNITNRSPTFVSRTSLLYNGNLYTDKMASLY